ncbi:LysM peptidoglycan-binding domain-containing protein [Salinibacterium hongtaonis]|uniref:LysM peptidoglycan-binding domain-containing protein n=1 Tax=Homoserinimonas hongtaonis TaxID=2079791 RepID=UPI000D3A07F5|nr:LysM peptidoglycan-binding domain-containing protein [Salinibacterium hongtaonis]AWB88917.1 hypothetical protein C2138_04575 [Salinibacterium hongtaonis]
MSTTALQASIPTASNGGQGRSRLRLTRRGRIVFTTLSALPVVAIALVLGLNGGIATATDTTGAPVGVVTVDAGESLWSIASEISPNSDPRDFVAEVLAFNQLSSADVFPGQQLAIPSSLCVSGC